MVPHAAPDGHVPKPTVFTGGPAPHSATCWPRWPCIKAYSTHLEGLRHAVPHAAPDAGLDVELGHRHVHLRHQLPKQQQQAIQNTILKGTAHAYLVSRERIAAVCMAGLVCTATALSCPRCCCPRRNVHTVHGSWWAWTSRFFSTSFWNLTKGDALLFFTLHTVNVSDAQDFFPSDPPPPHTHTQSMQPPPPTHTYPPIHTYPPSTHPSLPSIHIHTYSPTYPPTHTHQPIHTNTCTYPHTDRDIHTHPESQENRRMALLLTSARSVKTARQACSISSGCTSHETPHATIWPNSSAAAAWNQDTRFTLHAVR